MPHARRTAPRLSRAVSLTDDGQPLDLPVAAEVNPPVVVGVGGLEVEVAVLVDGELEARPIRACRALVVGFVLRRVVPCRAV